MVILSNKIDEVFNPTTNDAKHTYYWDYIFLFLLQNKCQKARIMYLTNPVISWIVNPLTINPTNQTSPMYVLNKSVPLLKTEKKVCQQRMPFKMLLAMFQVSFSQHVF